jgi:hypothetical protein
MTVGELQAFLASFMSDDQVWIQGTLADGTVIGVRDIDVTSDQGGRDGDGVEVVLGWAPGAEVITPP